MSSPTSSPASSNVPARKIRLSSLHRRTYPKDHPTDLQFSFSSSESIATFLTPSSSDILPEHTAPTSQKYRQNNDTVWNGINLVNLQESRTFWIALYFFLNFALTLYNKMALNKFPFPYSITALHMMGCCLGTSFLMTRQHEAAPMLSLDQIVVLLLFSILYTMNIVVSNVSLQLVTVPFHQVVRSSAPFFTLLLSTLLLNSYISWSKLISLAPVVAGVALATYGDCYYTTSGFFLTLLGTFLAALKTVITNILQSSETYTHHHQDILQDTSTHKIFNRSTRCHSTPLTPSDTASISKISLTRHISFSSIPKLHLTSLQLLHLLSPLALFQCLLLALYFGEVDQIITRLRITSTLFEPRFPLSNIFALAINSCMAFALNVVSFQANRKIGPLGISVAGNVKQVLTILSSVVLFNITVTKMNALGITLTLLGGVFYTVVDTQERRGKVHAR